MFEIMATTKLVVLNSSSSSGTKRRHSVNYCGFDEHAMRQQQQYQCRPTPHHDQQQCLTNPRRGSSDNAMMGSESRQRTFDLLTSIFNNNCQEIIECDAATAYDEPAENNAIEKVMTVL